MAGTDGEAFEVSRYHGFESPIEMRLHTAMLRIWKPEQIQRQVEISRYRVDFLVEGRFVIECDGKDFHEHDRDRQRDGELLRSGFIPIHCSGHMIHFQPNRVSEKIREIIFFYGRVGIGNGRDRAWKINEPAKVSHFGEK